MRVGFNPNKDKTLPKSDYTHQVIVPVYIPHQEDYFRDSFQILQFCLESLITTSHSKTYITVVNNGSCAEVILYLNQLHQDGKIQEVIHTTAIGKLNAILKGLTGHQFPLITITDADVLFLNHWQKATYEVFEAFPKAGAVSPVPNPKMCRYLTSNVILENLFTNKIKFADVKNSDALIEFAKSVGNHNMFDEIHLKKCLIIENKKVKSVIGAGHFVATYRGEVFEKIKDRFTSHMMGFGEGYYLDNPVVEMGFWRLSTENNFAFHMGNTLEAWMSDKLIELKREDHVFDRLKNEKHKINKTYYWLNNFLFSKIIYRPFFWELFLLNKGIARNDVKKYK